MKNTKKNTWKNTPKKLKTKKSKEDKSQLYEANKTLMTKKIDKEKTNSSHLLLFVIK